jgi:integrase
MKRRPLTLTNLAWRTARFEKAHGADISSEIQNHHLRDWLSSLGELSPVSLNNYRRVLHAMFSFAVSDGYCTSNSVAKNSSIRGSPKSAAILRIEEGREADKGRLRRRTGRSVLLGYVTLGLFAGLRRAEIERLDWSAVKWERQNGNDRWEYREDGEHSQCCPFAPTAVEWLNLCRLNEGKVVPRNINPN